MDTYLKILQKEQNLEDHDHVFMIPVAATSSWRQGIFHMFPYPAVCDSFSSLLARFLAPAVYPTEK
jgi:hypothetical protein